MKRFIIFITFLVGLSSIVCCSPKGQNLLEGFWYDSYPMNDSSGGFLFMANGEFYYFHLSNQNIERRFLGSYGEWRIKTNDIEIRIEKHFFLQNPVILKNAPAGKYLIGADNIIKYLDVKNTDWRKIGDLQEINSAHFPSMFVQKGIVDKGLEFPCILLPQINNAIITESILYYQTEMLDNLSSDVIDTVKKLKNSKKGTQEEWSPGNPIQVIDTSKNSS